MRIWVPGLITGVIALVAIEVVPADTPVIAKILIGAVVGCIAGLISRKVTGNA
jgi:hypothetical protein